MQAGVAILGALAILIGAGFALQHVGNHAASLAPLPVLPDRTALGSSAVVAENEKPGTTDWRISDVKGAAGIEGYADHTSVAAGATVHLYVSTSAPTFVVNAYRMGYYGGLGGRLVWQSPSQKGTHQAKATVDGSTGMVQAPWKASLSITIDAAWVPGDYLLKLVGSGGQQRYVPLTVVDAASTAALVIVNAVTTWEAYNIWGGYNLYSGPDGSYATRSRVVSFDRPYASAGSGVQSGDGSADFLPEEFPLVYFAESYGLDVTYITDIDLHEQGAKLLARHKAVIIGGLDEYWTAQMRQAVTAARDAGVNLAFMGANEVYRQIRLQPSQLGANREEVDYKDATEDPDATTNPALVTVNWRDPPVNMPESSLVGQSFECNPSNPASAVIVDAGNWLFAGTGLQDGGSLSKVIGPWYDRVNPDSPLPPDLEVLAHSPVTCPGAGNSFSDMTYYSTPSGAGVFAAGTTGWVCELAASCTQDPRTHPDERILQITKNLLLAFSEGPAGALHPSTSNLVPLGITKAAPAATATP